MDINALQAFLAVAETASFSKAAGQLYLSQPAISKRIANLETQLGTQLFDRIGKKTHLTESGQILFPKAQSIIAEIEESKTLIQNLSGKVDGQLRLGTSHHIGLHRLPPVLSQFHQSYPTVSLDIDFTDSELASDAVLHGDIEMAVVTLPDMDNELLRFREIWNDPLEFVCNTSHPLTLNTGPISLEKLAGEDALLPSSATATRKIVDQVFMDQGIAPSIGMETNYLETLKMMTSIGLGWTALPAVMVDDSLHRLDVEHATIARKLGVVTHRERTLSNAAEAFLRLLSPNRFRAGLQDK